jgi:hypothetical protein
LRKKLASTREMLASAGAGHAHELDLAKSLTFIGTYATFAQVFAIPIDRGGTPPRLLACLVPRQLLYRLTRAKENVARDGIAVVWQLV